MPKNQTVTFILKTTIIFSLGFIRSCNSVQYGYKGLKMKYNATLIIFFISAIFLYCENNSNETRKIKLTRDNQLNRKNLNFDKPTILKFDAEKKLDIAILTFENKTADTSLAWLCPGITDMLIRDLSQSRYLKVITMQRIYDILKKFNVDSPCTFNDNILSIISKETNVDAIVKGDFTNYNDSLLINVQLYNTKTGELIQEKRATGLGLAKIFGMVDELSKKVRNVLKITLKETSDQDLKITDISTSSLDAYKYYTKKYISHPPQPSNPLHQRRMCLKQLTRRSWL